MSPFAGKLKSLRILRGLRQVELANLVGYEQSYVSALELGVKGPPNGEFIENLIKALNLSQIEQETLKESVEASQRNLCVPAEAPAEVFYLFNRLRKQIDHLHPCQIELIQTALNLPINVELNYASTPARIRRRQSTDNKMEVNM